MSKEQQQADSAWIGDAHWGKGGRYVLDPATGIRTPVSEEPLAADPTAQSEQSEQPEQPVKGKKNA